MLMSSGFTDDLFPADETIRYYNRTKGTSTPTPTWRCSSATSATRVRRTARTTVVDDLRAREEAWFDHYIKGEGAEPRRASTPTPRPAPATPPRPAPTRRRAGRRSRPGEIRYRDEGEQTIAADSTTGGQFNPVGSATPAPPLRRTTRAGAAVYRLDAAPAGGYTLIGAGTVIAELRRRQRHVADRGAAARRRPRRDPDARQPRPLAARRRPTASRSSSSTRTAGRSPRATCRSSSCSPPTPAPSPLASYGRPSNGQAAITVSNLKLRLPVVERPGSLGGLVGAPAPKVLPEGYELAADFKALQAEAEGEGPQAHGQGQEGARERRPARPPSSPATTSSCASRQGRRRRAAASATRPPRSRQLRRDRRRREPARSS